MANPQTPLHSLEERIATRVEEIRTTRGWWPCRRGCDRCCRQLARPLQLSATEWTRIDHAIASLSPSLQTAIHQRINTLLEQIANQTVGDQVVCPFLDHNEGACLIYAARPIACRTYGFYISRLGDDYCEIVESEVANHQDNEIIWGNAETLREELRQLDETSISFEDHYLKRE